MSSISQRFGNLSPLKQALLALEEMGARLAKSERERLEPIAIIGMGCRFPSAADTAAYWQMMANGVDAVKEIPSSRWATEDYFDPNPDAPGKMYTRWAGLVDNLDQFDPEFFGISPREATSMDPQQRLLLEVVWEALENAGQGPRAQASGHTGVFVGITSDEYSQLFYRDGDLSMFNGYFTSGIARSIAGGRISYVLGLEGPNLSLDTACSSSLVAVHTACLNLRMGECRLAVAGGANVVLSPEIGISYSRARMMAPDGRCKAFDSRADGFVRAEGCGIVVLKRLSDALADGDNILAVIRGSAVNQDGRSSSLTAPNGTAQESVIRKALANAGVQPQEIGYVEAHGTGTALGDPIEAHALAAALGVGRTSENTLVVGSVKTNLGHLESAAGVAGLIKVVLSLQHEAIPPNLHFQQMNPHINWRNVPVEIPVAERPWPRGEKKRLAGISAFGFSGTNAHVIVEEAPARTERKRGLERPLHLLALSARNHTALKELAERYEQELANSTEELADICYTANSGRTHFEHRIAVVGETVEQVRRKLSERKTGEAVRERSGIRPVFLFSGQGSQYAGMGKQFYETHGAFRKAIDECEELVRAELEKPLREVLWGGSTQELEQTAYTQPALFALEYAVSELWRSWGIEPGAVLGHSVGEYVAACAAGVYSLADGMKLIVARGRLMQAVSGQGAMSAVMATEEKVAEALRGLEERVSIAGLNAPESVVISGYEREVGIAEERLKEKGIRVQRLAVSHAFHSPQMVEMEEAFELIAAGIEYKAPKVKMISSMTGKEIGKGEITAAYWRRQVREPVRFRQAMETLKGTGQGVYLEVGPGSTLAGLGRQCLEGSGGGNEDRQWLLSMKKNRGEWEQILESLGRLYERGAEVDWDGFDKGYNRRRVALPTYPFQRQSYWIASSPAPRLTSPDKRTIANRNGSTLHDDWFYRVAWEEKEPPNAPSSSPAIRHWLVLADRAGVAEKLIAKIHSAGFSCVVLNGGSDLGQAIGACGISPVGIVDLRFMEAHDAATSRHSCMAVVSTVRDIVKSEHPALRLWIVTRGAHAAGLDSGQVSPWQAPAWGLGRSLESENSESWGGLIDLDPAADPSQNCDLLWKQLVCGDNEDQAAFRGGRRLVARLERQSPSPADKPSLRADGAYVITGAFGGLGPEIARWMVGLGARHLILMGRTPLPPRSTWGELSEGNHSRTISTIRELEECGVTVRTEAIDVADVVSLRRCFDGYEAECGLPIRGVVHAAGVLRHVLVSEATEENIREQFRGKVEGAWALHETLAQAPLDFFVLFSSASSVLSSPRLGTYAAANAFLDSLAAHRQRMGLPALSVNWAAWSETGMGVRADASTVRAMEDRGMGGIKTGEGLYCLGRLLTGPFVQSSVIPADWQRWGERYPDYMRKPFLSTLALEFVHPRAKDDAAAVPAANGVKEPALLVQLANTPESDRSAVLLEYVHATAVRVLGFSADRRIDPKLPLNGSGLDSLLSLEFRKELSRDVGRALPATLLFSYPAIEDVALYLAQLLLAESAKPDLNAVSSDEPDEALKNIEELSDEEVDRRLAAADQEALR